MPTVYKTYTLVSGEQVSETLPNSRLFSVSGTASWFTPVVNPYISNLIGWTIIAPAIASYSVEFVELVDGEPFTWTIILNVVASAETVYDNCCDNQCNIAWLNRQGGWQNYIFTGVKEFSVTIGDTNTYVNNNLEQKYSEIKGVYNGRICSTGDIPKSHVDILESLQYAIQAFLYNTETEAWDIPILIDKKDFVKYRTRDKFFDVKIRFIIAEQVLIQSQ